ncbi:MAG: sodium:proton antiporter [Gemmatimonadetes bacterium]|nr:MAG: sodium:proton antiporter [Gemmatimonadota bacterium]
MAAFDVLSVLITLAALFAWLNHRALKLPQTIGLMVISLVFSLGLVALTRLGVLDAGPFVALLGRVDFDRALLDGVLGALLFAGALHVDMDDLRRHKLVIGVLASVGVLTSTFLTGGSTFWLFGRLGVDLPFIYCLLFGALVSPTDPIAVGAILKQAGVPHSLHTKITGESLFNDGIGVVVFLVIAGLAAGGGVHGGEAAASGPGIATLLVHEVAGGVAFGAAMGWGVYRLLASVENYQVEIMLTVAIVTGGYAAAQAMHVSGPLAMVVAGLLIGNRGRTLAMSPRTVERLDQFWELADEFLNAVLFVMIGIEVLAVDFARGPVVAGLAAIPIVLGARWVAVGVPVTVLRRWRTFTPHAVKILTWAGLRGGISVALALSVPAGPQRSTLITITYLVVLFSIFVQGLTVGPLVRRLMRRV